MSRVLVERFKRGDDILEGLNALVRQNHISAGSFTGLGVVDNANVGYFVGEGQYSEVSPKGPLEIVSFIGNVSMKEGLPFVHAHISLADKQGRVYGGHLMPGCTVGPTFEVVLHTYEGIELERKLDPATKLYLLDA